MPTEGPRPIRFVGRSLISLGLALAQHLSYGSSLNKKERDPWSRKLCYGATLLWVLNLRFQGYSVWFASKAGLTVE